MLRRASYIALLALQTMACGRHDPPAFDDQPTYGAGMLLPFGQLIPQRLDVDSLMVRQYSAVLSAMREPPLAGRDSWRFLWLRSFHPAVAIRVDRTSSGCIIVTKEVTWNDSVTRQMLTRQDSIRIEDANCDKLLTRVASLEVWDASSPARPAGGVDGADWVFERGAPRYALARAWSPQARGPERHFRNAGLAFLSAARLQPDSSEIY